jgi:hypothetical protein
VTLKKIASVIGPEMTKALPALHAFSGMNALVLLCIEEKLFPLRH